MKRVFGKTAGLLAVWAIMSGSALAQQGTQSGGDLQAQVESLRKQVQAMQKDLDDIKSLLAPLLARRNPTLPSDLLIDLGDRPIKGASTAALTFIELMDYQ